MSDDPEPDYFADGVVEDIITALSRFKWLFVIARNSSFTYKGRAVDVKQVGRELGVRYVLEGSIRKSGNRVRIAAQLIEAVTGRHIWAERYDRDLTGIFEVQDEITQNVVAAIEPNLRSLEIARASSKPTDSLDAYDLYLRALPMLHQFTQEGFSDACGLLRQATSIDPSFSDAWAYLSDAISRMHNVTWANNPEIATRDACDAATRAISADPDNGIALATAAWSFAVLAGEHEQALEYVDRAIRLNPNSSFVHARCGLALVHSGEQHRAITSFDAALRLNPLDPERYIPLTGKAAALLFLRQFDDAAEWGARANRIYPAHVISMRYMMAAYALAGREAEASSTLRRLLDAHPHASISLVEKNPRRFRHNWMMELYIDGLRKAGLPE